jgi:SMC interacting uncharacterized protein involved in chromosome segregation
MHTPHLRTNLSAREVAELTQQATKIIELQQDEIKALRADIKKLNTQIINQSVTIESYQKSQS